MLGCAESDTDSFDMEDDGPSAEPQTGGESNNGLPSDSFYASQSFLLAAMSAPIVTANTTTISAAVVATGVMDTAEGRKALSYAIKCALPAGFIATHTVDDGINDPYIEQYTGHGILSSTADWFTAGGLTMPSKLDVLTCVLAHMNNLPNEQSVEIYVSGENVLPGPGDAADYPVDEAVFQARLSSTYALEFHVYALAAFSGNCSGDPELALKRRMCSDPDNNCNVYYHADTSLCVHDAQTDEYTCDGDPTIKTQLKYAGYSILHPSCIRRGR